MRSGTACPELATALSQRWTTKGLARYRRVLGARAIACLASNLR